MVKIRDAVRKDIPAISRLSCELAFFENKFNSNIKISKKRYVSTLRWYRRKFGKIKMIVAEDNDEIVAYATAFVVKKKPLWENFDVGYLCDIYVLPSCRGKGLGTKMTRMMVTWLNGKKVKRIKADAYVGNPAVELWKKLGLKSYSVGLVLKEGKL